MSEIAARRLDEKERRREEILDAAEQVFGERGYEAARMDDIARAARVSRALLYIYFKDKTELHFGIGLRALALLRERFAQARSRYARGVDQVTACGRAYIAFAQEFPVYFQAISRVEAHHAELEDANSVQHRLMMAGRLVHAETVAGLLLGQQDGTVRADLENPIRVAMTLWGFVHGIAQLAITKGDAFVSEGIALNDFIEGAVQMATRAVKS